MQDYIKIEVMCKEHNLQNLPALIQLRRAYSSNTEEAIKRISENIKNYIFSANNKK